MPESEAPAVDGVAVEINGHEVIARPGELLIDAAERAGTYIPRFCYHERMRPVGMCRMCLVEVDTGRGPALQPSCMIECTPGMKVDTESDITRKAQDGVLEFLLANHPLDCPVCDKGGECPLQDQTMAYGPGESRFVEEKRHKEKPIPISDLVLLDRERCILCDRCTRFAKEVAGDPLIHFIHRGNNTEVNTFPDEPFSSYFSGNTVQICPVGALTASTYRFKARPWDLETTESTCQTCSVGCRISIDSSRDQVQRFNGVDIDPVNWGWLCDKGRFSSEVVTSAERLGAPLLRDGDELVPARWSDALGRAAAALSAAAPEAIGVIGGARLTNEDAYAWAKLTKGVIGTDNVDAQLGDGLPAEVVLGLPRATIDEVCAPGGTVLLIGADIKEELPVLFLRLRHAVVEDGVTLLEITPRSTGLTSLASVSARPLPGEIGRFVAGLFGPTDGDSAGVPSEVVASLRAALTGSGSLHVVLGRGSLAESADAVVDAAAAVQAARPEARFLSALRRSNVHGALDMGLAPGLLPGRVDLDEGRDWFAAQWPGVPAARGLDTHGMLRAAADGRLEVLVLLGADPLADHPDRDLARRALTGAGTVIAVDTVLSESAAQADVVLAAAGFAEKAGTTTNLEGRVSTLAQRVTPPGTARADWMLAAELASRMGTDLGFGDALGILTEIGRVVPSHLGLDPQTFESFPDGVLLPLENATEGAPRPVEFRPDAPVVPASADPSALRLVVTRRLYDQGVLVQSAEALAGLARPTSAHLHPEDLRRLGLTPGQSVTLRSARAAVPTEVTSDEGVAPGTVALVHNQTGVRATDLIDAGTSVTEVGIETA